jgi:hypothetical protein
MSVLTLLHPGWSLAVVALEVLEYIQTDSPRSFGEAADHPSSNSAQHTVPPPLSQGYIVSATHQATRR